MKGRQVQDALSVSDQHFPLWHPIGINVHFTNAVLGERAGRDGENFSVHWNKKRFFYNVGPFKIPFSLLALITIILICKLQTLKNSSEDSFEPSHLVIHCFRQMKTTNNFLSFIRKLATTFNSVRLWLWGWRTRTWSSCRSCPPWPDFSEQQSSSWAAVRKINTVAQQRCPEEARTLPQAAEFNWSWEKAGRFFSFFFQIPGGETLWVTRRPKRKTSNPPNYSSTERRIMAVRIAL